MSEIIYTYEIDNPNNTVPYNRKQFYDEELISNKVSWLPTRYTAVANTILVNSEWELLLQKRSINSKQNPWMLSKTVWGHMEYLDSADETIAKESIQEIWVPVYISRKGHFENDLKSMWLYTDTIAIIESIKIQFLIVTKIIDWKKYKFWAKEYSYAWIYNWKTEFNDGEVEWLEKKQLDKILEDIKIKPEIYTEAFVKYIKSNKEYLLNLIKKAKNI